jgi:hypothetical protein
MPLINEDPPGDECVAPAGGEGRPVPALPAAAAGDPPAPREPEAAADLTPEEQMALFEKELKEKDWGHQPC